LFWLRVRSYRQKKDGELKLWREQANASAWLQGLYVLRAINSCFPQGEDYPSEPIHLLNYDGTKTEEEVSKDCEREKAKATQDKITARILQVQSFFKRQSEDK